MRRPCGHVLTDRAVAWCAFEPGATLLDIGCGDGKTARYLREFYGFDVRGLDKKEGGLEIVGDAAALPFANAEFDAVLFQCSFSVMQEPERALREAYRVLKPGGWLVVDDFYARGAEKNLLGISIALGRMERLQTIVARLNRAGFALALFEDHTATMRREWAEAIFEGGHDAMRDEIAAHREALREAKSAYGLFVARREER